MALTVHKKKYIHLVFRLSVLVALVLVVRGQLLSLELDALGNTLERVGWTAILVLLPASLITFADTLGWAACITRKSRDVAVGRLIGIRISCDAVCYSLPAGVAAGEGLRSVLLRDRCGIDMTESAASCLLGKVNMAIAHMTYICMVGVPVSLGIAGVVHTDVLPGGDAAVMAGTVGAGLMLVGLFFLFTGPRLSQALRVVERIPLGGLQRMVRKTIPHLVRVDAHVSSFVHQHPSRFRRSLAFFFGGWLALGAESVIILLLLGVKIPLLEGLAIEAIVSVLRIMFFFLPSAAGAAEMAYIAILTSLGIPDPVTVSAAFITIKRSREALWIFIGYALLARLWSLRNAVKKESAVAGGSLA